LTPPNLPEQSFPPQPCQRLNKAREFFFKNIK